MPDGAKYWRLRYRIAGKERVFALGVFPEVSLDAARSGRDEARHLIREGVDPVQHRRQARAEARAALEAPMTKRYPRVVLLPGDAIDICTERAALHLTRSQASEILSLLGTALAQGGARDGAQ